MRILITGATGYIGRRLKYRFLQDKNITIRLMVKRDTAKIESEDVEIVKANTFDIESLYLALKDVDVAYYFVHSMNAKDYRRMDNESAKNFLEACITQGVKRIIYLGGLGEKATASEHLLSRLEVGEMLSSRPNEIETLWFRAGVIIGSGSASYEIIRNLTEKLPFMITPKWVYTLCQPSAQKDIMEYLYQGAFLEEKGNHVVDLGGEIMPYKNLLLGYAKVAGLKRTLIPVPFFTPKLSSYWLTLMTPVPYAIASELIEGLRSEVVIKNDLAKKLFPTITPMPYLEAVAQSLEEIKNRQVISRWSDASGESWENNHLDIATAIFINRQKLPLEELSAKELYETFCTIGGDKGWFGYDFLWHIRGFIDKVFGGYGLSRGRRDPLSLRMGDSIDFWKVVDLQDEKRLLLFAQMKVPGKAWLEFLIQNNTFYQTAYFYPQGLLGRFYWYGLTVLHFFLFRGMANNIIESAKKHKNEAKRR